MPLNPQTVSSADRKGAIQTNDDPGYHSMAYLRQVEDVELCRDVYAGTRKLREGGTRYLPQFEKEEDGDYKERKEQAVLFNGFRKTVKGLAGMVFRKPPVLGDDVPEAIRTHAENIDLAGRNLRVFARDTFQAKLLDGHTCILVDWRTAEGARSRAEEEGARPYWVNIAKQQVIRWRTENIGGETVLTRFAYVESDTRPDGEFAEKAILRVRQYDLDIPRDGDEKPLLDRSKWRVQYQSWTRDADKNGGEWTPEKQYTLGERMTQIPVAVDYAERVDVLESTPPLLDLAFLSVRHYQLQSDRDNLVHFSHRPLHVFTGVPKTEVQNVTLGAGYAVVLEPEKAKAQVLESTGAALSMSAEEVDRLERRMAALGVAVLVRRDRGDRTATETATDKAEQDSDLAAMAESHQDALEEALRLHAVWMGLEEGGSVSVNRDFLAQQMTPQTADFLLRCVEAGKLSTETFWDRLVAGEILDDSFDPDTENQRIEEQAGASLEAVRNVIRREQAEDEGDELDEAA